MATQEQVDALKRTISNIRSTIAVYRRDLEEITNETLDANIAIAAAEKAGNAAEVSRQKAIVRDLRDEKNQTEADIEREENRLGPLGAQLAQAEQALKPQAPEPAPPATAGQTVKDDASATGPNAASEQKVGPDGRVVTPENSGPTNAAVQPTGENPAGTETGTNAPVKTTEQTQSIQELQQPKTTAHLLEL